MSDKIAGTWDVDRLRRDRLERVQTMMRQSGVGALYLSDPANFQYLTNVRVRSSKMFVPAEGEAIAFVRPRDIGYIGMEYRNVRLPLQARSPEGKALGRFELPISAIRELMAEHGVSGEPLGLDTVEGTAVLSLSSSGMPVADARPVLEKARSVKTCDEVEIYRSIGHRLVQTLKAFRESIRPGVTEHELASAVGKNWYGLGGGEVGELEICSGERTNPWQRWPTHRAVGSGEFVGIDFHARAEGGLIGDLSRTYFVGDQPSREQRDLYLRAREYMLAVTDTLRAGRSIGEVVDLVPEVPEKFSEQLYNYNVAHSVGVTWASLPEINKGKGRDATQLEPNHVLTVESYFGEKGGPFAVKLERMLIVGEGEPEVLDAGLSLDDWMVT
jgi:Xaa-Pro aminopeptidase